MGKWPHAGVDRVLGGGDFPVIDDPLNQTHVQSWPKHPFGYGF